ncbi:MAG: hypothetical protein ACHWZW_02740 [Spirulina sp.]
MTDLSSLLAAIEVEIVLCGLAKRQRAYRPDGRPAGQRWIILDRPRLHALIVQAITATDGPQEVAVISEIAADSVNPFLAIRQSMSRSALVALLALLRSGRIAIPNS